MSEKQLPIDNDELARSLFVALSGYIKEAYLEGYDIALLNKTSSDSVEELFLNSDVKTKINTIINKFAPKDISIPEDYVPCVNCLRLIHITEHCDCRHNG